MPASPRIRRLRSDYNGLSQLREESTILDFDVPGVLYGGPPEAYEIRFYGKGFWRDERSGEVLIRERHDVTIVLGAGYPRMMPELRWKTPCFHPNISASGVVCLGGYGTNWVPSLNLDELCHMLWDMIRYRNYDVESPYNREAANWAKTQARYRLPIDPRPIRDRVAGVAPARREPPITSRPQTPAARDVLFLDNLTVEAEVVEAEVVEPEDPGILFID